MDLISLMEFIIALFVEKSILSKPLKIGHVSSSQIQKPHTFPCDKDIRPPGTQIAQSNLFQIKLQVKIANADQE